MTTKSLTTPACDLRQMRYFVAVAEALSFRRAAEQLNVAQPALSRAIRQLEETLEVRLLERNNRWVELTEVGAVFLDGCRQTLSSAERTFRDTLKARAGEIGNLTIGYTDFAISGILPELIQVFRSRYPEITVELVHMVTFVQLEALASGEIQVGAMTGPLAEPGLDQVMLQNDRLVVILPKTHRLAKLDAIPLAKLAGEPFVTGQEAYWRHYLTHMMAVCQSAGFRPRIVEEAYNSEGIFGLVAANMGLTLHVEAARNYFRRGLAIRPLQDTDYRVPTVAAWNEDDRSPSLALFIAFAKQWLQEHDPEEEMAG